VGSSVVDDLDGLLGDLFRLLLEDEGGGKSDDDVDCFDVDEGNVDVSEAGDDPEGGLTLLVVGLAVGVEDDILSLILSASTESFSSLLARSPSADILTLERGMTEARAPLSFLTGVSGADLLPAPGIGSMMTSLNVLAMSSLLLLDEAKRPRAISLSTMTLVGGAS
jgi:hypothetical protein